MHAIHTAHLAHATHNTHNTQIVTAIKPQDNSDLEGLYKSSGNYCTQVGTATVPPVTRAGSTPACMCRHTDFDIHLNPAPHITCDTHTHTAV